MQSLKDFAKRNAPVFLSGFIILVVFVAIILSSPKPNNSVPAGFKKVEETVFNDRTPAEPAPEQKPTEYAPQIPSPDNKGRPYFYGESNPNLRDVEGYPVPPSIGSTPIPPNTSKEDQDVMRAMEAEVYQERIQPTRISFTEAGFSPENAIGYTGTEIIWTNNTTRGIKIVETVPVNEALKNGISIKPGGSFSFKPLKVSLFTYLETASNKYASVNVSDITTPLLGNTVEK